MVKQGKKTKIVLVGYRLANGGLERVLSTVSDLLHYSNCEVHVIVLENEVEYPVHGTLIKLGHYSKFQKYFKLRSYLKRNQFDYVIDFRHRINPWMELLFIHYMYAGFKFIYTIHSSKLDVYLTAKNWVAQQILNKAYKIVAVSNALNEKIKTKYYFEKGVVIPNSIAAKTIEIEYAAELFFKYCIAVGRLVKLKQFDKLIDTYCTSDLPKREIHLVILGEGEEKERLEKQIERLQMSKFIHLLGFKNNVFCYVKNAKFLVLTSKYEGFPMVILEAHSCGAPVVSFDAPTGPRNIIHHNKDGILVDNNNEDEFVEILENLALNQEKIQVLSDGALQNSKNYELQKVMNLWKNLIFDKS